MENISVLPNVIFPFCLFLHQEVFNYKIAARPERRRQFEKELTSQMEVALSTLTACLHINELKEQVKTFLRMMRFATEFIWLLLKKVSLLNFCV